MREPLQAWYDAWRTANHNSDLIYIQKNRQNEPTMPQLHFVRDVLANVVWADKDYADRPDEPPPRDTCKETAWVIGEHTSKSVRLPVYSIERPDLGIQFVLRENYYDWNVSVIAENAIVTDLRGFQLDFDDDDKKRFARIPWHQGRSWGYCYFQGFPEELQFGPYSQNPRRFSICIGSEYKLFTFVWLIMRDWRTR